ncbi:hypothetical protein ACWGOQ_0009440 [Aquimarina sp. M1]
MNRKFLILLSLGIFSFSCNKSSTAYERFFIPKGFGNKGVVNKYYIHIYPKNQQNKKTILDYSFLKKLNDSIYSKETFGPSFGLQSSKQFRIAGEDVIETTYKRYYLTDTLVAHYTNDTVTTFLTFQKDTVYYKTKLKNKDSLALDVYQYTKTIKDTIIQNKPAKIIGQFTTNTTIFGETPRDTIRYHARSIYVQDLGLWKSTLTTDTDVVERVLVEQLLPEQFDKLSKHGIERVGYIDFDKTIDKDKKLELCSSTDFIVDYYNGGNDRAGFIGGKGNLKKLVGSKLDTNKLHNESGYLTFRFVINCKGKAGKFITDESADFDYNKKQFSKKTVMHLYDIISGVEQWKPCVIRNTKRDSYFYVTFILKNGEIQDILP